MNVLQRIKSNDNLPLFVCFAFVVMMLLLLIYIPSYFFPKRDTIVDSTHDSNGKLIVVVKEMPNKENNNKFLYFVCYNSILCGLSGATGVDDNENEVDEKKYLEVKEKNLEKKLKEAIKNLNTFKETNNYRF